MADDTKIIYVLKYITNFNGMKRWKYKMFSTRDNAKKFVIKYYETGFIILDYVIETHELDYDPKNNNVYKDGEVIK